MSQSRLYNLDTVYNFRDFGDYPTHDGGHVAAGKLFRAAHLANGVHSVYTVTALASVAGVALDPVCEAQLAAE